VWERKDWRVVVDSVGNVAVRGPEKIWIDCGHALTKRGLVRLFRRAVEVAKRYTDPKPIKPQIRARSVSLGGARCYGT